MPQQTDSSGLLQGGVFEGKELKFRCPVCAFWMSKAPVDYTMCPSCGTEFGVDDVDQSFSEIRSQWLDAGAPWWSTLIGPPENWNPIKQIKEFREELANAIRPFEKVSLSKLRELSIFLGKPETTQATWAPGEWQPSSGIPLNGSTSSYGRLVAEL